MNYRILKGNHYNNERAVRLHFGKKPMKRIVKFHSSCFYDLKSEDQADINKLYGFSEGLHHYNSARFGWRANTITKEIELLAYVYCDGKRINEWNQPIFIRSVKCDQLIETEIKIFKEYYQFIVKTQYGESECKVKRGKRCLPIGYELYPYFGGNRTAPHDMYLEVSKV